MSAFLPLSLPNSWTWDAEIISQRVSEDAGRLFAAKGDGLEIWTLSSNGLAKQSLANNDLVRQHFKTSIQEKNVFYVVRQENTWSRFRISHGSFQSLLSCNGVFPYFLDTLHDFGYRSRDNDSTWNNFHCRRSGEGLRKLEICYTVRFFEENQRNRGNPWSLRQTAVYQGVDYSTNTSAFIFLQPSSYIEERLGDKLRAIAQDESLHEIRHILLHVVLLSSTLINWRRYIATQMSDLEGLEEKTTFSKADYRVKNDFSLRFSDRQSLHSLQQTLTKAARLLDCSIDLGEKMKGLFRDEDFHEFHNSNLTLLQDLQDYIYEASYHRRVISDLLQRSTDTCNLLTSILQYRVGNSELESTRTLVTIASQGETDGKIAHKTATSAAALTFTATIYLPASLLAGIFSSNLIDVKDDHFVLAMDFWKFIVILIPLTLLTLGLVALCQWYLWRSYSFKASNTRVSRDGVAVI